MTPFRIETHSHPQSPQPTLQPVKETGVPVFSPNSRARAPLPTATKPSSLLIPKPPAPCSAVSHATKRPATPPSNQTLSSLPSPHRSPRRSETNHCRWQRCRLVSWRASAVREDGEEARSWAATSASGSGRRIYAGGGSWLGGGLGCRVNYERDCGEVELWFERGLVARRRWVR
ncbi:hypothetical protein M0R45_004856 [Rubus argutus]|uniref:Uncharacterized protein n=1 Tax=Rubus argutus TaxID=59490 RepID=A0AAW1YLC8_RUBAR